MNTKILVSLLVIGLTAIAIGGTMTGAFFTDTATSTGNTFTTGEMKLQIYDGAEWKDDVTGTITATGMYPTQTTTGRFCFKNAGTIPGIITVTTSYDRDAITDEFAKNLAVTEAYIEPDTSDNKAIYWAQQIADEQFSTTPGVPNIGDLDAAVTAGYAVKLLSDGKYYPTLYGLQTITLHFWDHYTTQVDQAFPADYYACENIKVLFYESGEDQTALQGKTLTAAFTAKMKQVVNP